MKAVAGLNVEELDKEATWMADAEEAQRKGNPEVARAFYDQVGAGGGGGRVGVLFL